MSEGPEAAPEPSPESLPEKALPDDRLFEFTVEELVEELRRRFPVGVCYLSRIALGNEDVEVFAPMWGNPFMLLGVFERGLRLVHHHMDVGDLKGVGESTAGDEATMRRAWDPPDEDEGEDEDEVYHE